MEKLVTLYPSSDLIEALNRLIAMIAIPFFFWGFEFWGDEVPSSIAVIDIPFCLCFYSLLGAFIGRYLSRCQHWHATMLTLLIVILIVAVLLGVSVYLDD
jgi:hypothetical protein